MQSHVTTLTYNQKVLALGTFLLLFFFFFSSSYPINYMNVISNERTKLKEDYLLFFT